MTERTPNLPLRGLKVLDFSQNLPGPYATFLLTGWGADVIKVEPPKGDPGRFMEPFFSMVNRGKRSIVLDLRAPESRAPLEALVRWADVIVEGFRPGVMARLGCDFERARALNPRIVYCSISAYGQEGPLRDHPGHDLNLQAVSGVCHLERDVEGTPRGTMLPIADLSSSLLAVSSICAALAQGRDEARYLDIAMADGALSWSSVWGRGVDLAADAKRGLGSGAVVDVLTRPLVAFLERAKLYAMPHYGVFQARCGRWLSLGIVDEAHFWKALALELDLAPLAKLPMSARIAAGPALRPLVARRIKRRDRETWLACFEARGIPASPVLTPEEAANDRQVQARGLVDQRGWMRAPLPHAVHPSGGAPSKGEHTDAILREIAVEREAAEA